MAYRNKMKAQKYISKSILVPFWIEIKRRNVHNGLTAGVTYPLLGIEPCPIKNSFDIFAVFAKGYHKNHYV